MSTSVAAPAGYRRVRTTRPGTVLACICACTVLVVGFVASINLAVPMLASSGLHPSSSALLWIVDAYVVFFACLVIPGGAIGDRLGRKGVLICGLAVFAAGALISAAAGSVAVMLAGRVLTGIGAAGVLPNALAVLIHATPPSRRRAAIAVWAAMSGVAPIAAALAGWAAIGAPRSDRTPRALDPRAVILLTIATLALLIGIIQGPDEGWASALVIGAFAAAAALFLGWALVELRAQQPLLDPRLFRVPALRAACLGMLVVFFGMFGLFYLNASLLQYGRGFTVIQAGFAILPLTAPLLIGARRVPALVAKAGDRTVLAVAFTTTGGGLYGLGTAIDQPYVIYAVWLVIVGTGITLALPTLTIAITAALPREQAGVAGGLQATTRELGSALGVAIVGTLLNSQFAHHLQPAHAAGPRTVAAALQAWPAQHAFVIAAYTASASTALKSVAIITIAAGALVIAEMVAAARRGKSAVSIDLGLDQPVPGPVRHRQAVRDDRAVR
jgi:MFS family permease